MDSNLKGKLLVKGAREHNLKNVELMIPKNKLVVFTGVSGSGKSSLAFDTIYAEGQRRYVESLSSYARQFLGLMEKPNFDTIRGLSPTIAIEQKSASKNPRSTVGTITEVYDYLRVLFARLGTQHCIHCGKQVGVGNAASMVKHILNMGLNEKILVLAKLIDNRKGEHKDILSGLKAQGIIRIRLNGVVQEIDQVQALAKNKKHTIEAVIDRLVIKSGVAFKKRISDSVETALKLGKGEIIIHRIAEKKDHTMSEKRTCCNTAYRDLEPSHFSFNSPQGMCVSCQGLGSILKMDAAKIVLDQSLSIRDGAVIPWQSFFEKEDNKESWGRRRIQAMQKQWKLNLDTPWKKLSKKMRDWILYGPKTEKDRQLVIKWNSQKGSGSWKSEEEGLVNRLMRRYQQTSSDIMKNKYARFMSRLDCDACEGKRLQQDLLHVYIDEHSIMDVCSLTIEEAHAFLSKIKWNKQQLIIAGELIKEIMSRLGFLLNVGLNYLSLDRYGPSLSGGEAQRIRLASQIGSELTGVIYILDEPSIGLHQRDNTRLLNTLLHLRDLGNSLIVVEHDRETIDRSDWVVDIGPGAGLLGGEVVAEGTPKQIYKNKNSLTGKYLSGGLDIPIPAKRRKPNKNSMLMISGASEHNLKEITVEIPLGLLNCITGVSGAGKSTLVGDIIHPFLANQLMGAQLRVGQHEGVEGYDLLDKVIHITQQAIGRTPRSNPATYVKVFEPIRDVFAALPESKMRGYSKGRFSFNVKGGRCETCKGDGYVRVEMHFLADVFVPCEDCKGQRFNEQTLEINYKGHSIADVLDLSVRKARELFTNHRTITSILDTLMAVGLDYIKLGQSATSLSGGEAQRIKLAKELAKKDTGKTLYILDEPTTGLHFEDIRKLLEVLQSLVDKGNTILLIEHNLDVIKTVDWIIDLGPEGGEKGGQIIGTGSPEKLVKVKKSYTGRYLLEALTTS
ncbi:MAG: excinuclease ABC subunit UvrA [Oligoflexales bacterium]